jgi:hypothetical protein
MPGCNAYSRNGCSQGDIHIAVACFTQRKMVSLHRENATIADVITFVNMHGFAVFSTLRKDVFAWRLPGGQSRGIKQDGNTKRGKDGVY